MSNQPDRPSQGGDENPEDVQAEINRIVELGNAKKQLKERGHAPSQGGEQELRDLLEKAVTSIKVNADNQPLERACPWNLNWFEPARQLLDRMNTRVHLSLQAEGDPYKGIPRCIDCGQLLSPHCEDCQPHPAAKKEGSNES